MGVLEGGILALVIVFTIVRGTYRAIRGLIGAVRRGVRPTPARPTPVAEPAPAPRRAQAPPAQPAPPAQTASRPEERVPRKQLPLPERKITLRPDGNDLVRALIWQEILSPPLSKRNPRQPPQ